MLIIGVFLLFMNINILLKLYQSLLKIKNGSHFFVLLVIPMLVTTFLFFVDRLLFFSFYHSINAYYSNQKLLMIFLVLSFFIAIIYMILFCKATRIKKKRYIHFQDNHIYVPLSEFLWTFTWNVLTVLLTYFFLYHYFYPEYFTSLSEQIYLIMFYLSAIIWCFLSVISYTFIRQYIFCVTCINIVIHQATYDSINQLFNRAIENKIVLQGSEITVELERYIQKGLLKIRRNQSLSEIGEEDKIRLYFEQPFVKIIQNREEGLEKGFFFEKYFDDTSVI
ncbi:hypothetical protein [Enterococcus faecalis]|uniref:hypothetical protein n=1 Tax=Enterococcus TaxID=1350 RepID=UPI00070FA5BB|nr:hypothetical protein [Enterococcus faecalis]KXF71666.1 hypothetical protein AQ486_03525 [Enterococcus faecalis]KXF73967.1 hypothetical protein AQ487_03875 [Enterococcus faecalis]MBC2812586.1 hypothetical protein [Enterococcus faecalis]MBC2816486.1 hypothetical protein [Enterococcus faecalis]MBC2819495.1 hypothetical protein [Enterococcus faecalis]